MTLLDQGELPRTGGSTSHAPGLVFSTSPSRMLSCLASATVAALKSLEHPDGPCLLPVGGLEVATTPERADELYRRQGLGRSFGVRSEVIGPQRCAELHPMLDECAVLAGLHSPDDGLAKAVRACESFVARTTSRGASVRGGVRVTSVSQRGGRVTGVETDAGPLPTDVVVLCAGF